MDLEINFYQCDDLISNSVAPLMMKVLNENKKALIIAADSIQMKEIDNSLWSYGKNKFIPHVVFSDKDFDLKRQPIVISDKEENFNEADYLVLTREVSEDFLKGFARVFYFYHSLDADKITDLFPKYKTIASKINSYKKSNSGWIKETK
jgi:DNA polymerase IIIc chi subunit